MGGYGLGRLVAPREGTSPVPFYETVRPQSDLVARLLANVETHLWFCGPLIEDGSLTREQACQMLEYALHAEHAVSPEREFSWTAGDVANDLLKFVQLARNVLNPLEVDQGRSSA